MFWKEVAGTSGGESISLCIQCNTCTSSCPVEAIDPAFKVRQIIARVKLGLRDDVLRDPAIWSCARCFACVAHCPKHVRPGDVIEAVRHVSLREGNDGSGARHTRAFVASMRESGRIHEARVTLDSIGFVGLAREGLLPLWMAFRGKLPALRQRPLGSTPEIRAIIDSAEESR